MDVDGISVAAALAIKNGSVVSGYVAPLTGHLILVTGAGAEIDAGLVITGAPVVSARVDGSGYLELTHADGSITINGNVTGQTIICLTSLTFSKASYTGMTRAKFEFWAGGGAGASGSAIAPGGGGGGGGHTEIEILEALLPTNLFAIVGAGAVTGPGGNSHIHQGSPATYFGVGGGGGGDKSTVAAVGYGGGGGGQAIDGVYAPGNSGVSTTGGTGGGNGAGAGSPTTGSDPTSTIGGAGGGGSVKGGNAYHGGGGGGTTGGRSCFGGGGGASGPSAAGGLSFAGGKGGDGPASTTSVGDPGVFPGGGGGGGGQSAGAPAGGKGGDGEIRITVYYN